MAAPATTLWTAAPEQTRFDNRSVASVFYEIADLMEINGDDSFRIRSYRRAAEAVEALGAPIADLVADPKKLLDDAVTKANQILKDNAPKM